MWNYAWHEIIRRKGRTAAAICSYALASIIFSVLISLFQYSEHCQYETLHNTGTHFIAFSPVCCNLPMLKDETHEGFWANGSRSAVMPVDLIDTIKALPSVKDASPFLMFRFTGSVNTPEIIVGGFDPGNSISVANTVCSANDIVSGRFITNRDTNAVLLEESFSRSHQIPIGKTVKITTETFQVAGIVNAGIRPAKADIYLPFTQAERIISRRTWNPIKGQMNIVLVESKDAESHKKAVQEVLGTLGKEKAVSSSYSCHNPAAEAINISQRLLWLGIIFVTIFTAVHVIRNHYASIIERRREIGILQSMGWQNRRIAKFIGYEFILHSLIGCILGSYIATIIQISLPSSKSSNHILCAIDTFSNTIISFGLVFFIAAVSALSFAFYFTRKWPATNLKTP